MRRVSLLGFLLVACGSSMACAARPLPQPSSPAPLEPRIVAVATPGDARAHDEWHYAPVTRAGRLVVVSGIAAARGDTYEEKIRHMFDRAKAELEAAGARLEDVVEISTFHVSPTHDAFVAEFAAFEKIHAEYFHPPYPSWTAIGNAALLAPGAVVEMRLVAVVGSGQGARVDRSTGP